VVKSIFYIFFSRYRDTSVVERQAYSRHHSMEFEARGDYSHQPYTGKLIVFAINSGLTYAIYKLSLFVTWQQAAVSFCQTANLHLSSLLIS